MRRFGGNGLIVAAALLVVGAQAIPLCLSCCSEALAPALQLSESGCCAPNAVVSCPIFERNRWWIQASSPSTWLSGSLPLAVARDSALVRADFKQAVTAGFLSTSHRLVSPPLLI
jgi:hypothetical protein